MYIQSISSGAHEPQESRDCTVRALANATDMPYGDAHKALQSKGRLTGFGCRAGVWHEAYTANGLKFIGVYGKNNTSKAFQRLYPVKPFKGVSLGALLPKLGAGRFIVMITGHAIAVVNGSIIDIGGNSSKKSVVAVYKAS